MTVGKAIYYLLTNSTDITDIVSTRVFPEIAQQDAEMPYIVYNIANNEPSDTKPEPSKLDTAQVDVNVYSQSYTQCIDLAVAVRAALDRVSGTYSGVNVQSIQYLNEVIDFDEMQRAYNITSDYDVRISRTNFEIAQGSPITGVKLGELSDVDVVGVTDNQILSYDAATDSWIAADDAGGLVDSVNGQTGTVTLGLDDLTDVDAGAPTTGQLLAYGQGDWTTISQDEITIGIENVTGLQAELNTIPDGIFDLDDVTQSGGTIAADSYLRYINGVWTNSAPPAPTPVYDELGELLDVTLTSPADNDFLRYNGTIWVNESITQYHNRYQTTAESLRAGATATTELYYTAQADGDGFAESASSDTPTAGYDIQRKLYYSEAAFADPDTGTWIQFAAIADNTTFANAKAALLAYLKERTGGTVPISLKMTWEEVSQTAYLLDQSYGSGAEAAYSTRQLRNAATDCMVIRRASDSTTTTIGFDGSGNIDESAIETFCTGTTCTVVTWKDQSGNGNDATAAASTNEPTIYTGGALVKQDGRVALDFDGTDDYLDISASILTSEIYLSETVAKLGSTSQEGVIWNFNQGTANESVQLGFNRYLSNEVLYRDDYGTDERKSGITNNTRLLYSVEQNVLRLDGNAQTGSAVGRMNSNNEIGGSVFPFLGNTQELLFWNGAKSTADRTSIEENIGDYFTQNTPLLDTYSGAAACYSLRLMRSAYTGALINVWNGTSYADIYPNVFGELDTVALAAHCGSNDGFIRYWYDQSGNSNTAAQTTLANMPKIYDGTTGVVTENGKPAVDFYGSSYFLKSSDYIVELSQNAASVFAVSASTSLNNAQYILSEGDSLSPYSSQFILGGPTGNDILWVNATAIGTMQTGQISIGFDYNQTTFQAYLDGNTSGSAAAATVNTETSLYSYIGTRADATEAFFNGKLQELITYKTNQSANRTGIEENINTFYSIY